MKNQFEVAKYKGKWSIYCKGSRTFFCIGAGKRYCEQRVKELNQ